MNRRNATITCSKTRPTRADSALRLVSPTSAIPEQPGADLRRLFLGKAVPTVPLAVIWRTALLDKPRPALSVVVRAHLTTGLVLEPLHDPQSSDTPSHVRTLVRQATRQPGQATRR